VVNLLWWQSGRGINSVDAGVLVGGIMVKEWISRIGLFMVLF
jgi:hypothetical protein